MLFQRLLCEFIQAFLKIFGNGNLDGNLPIRSLALDI